MSQDIRFALRAFRRQPMLYGTAMLGLALAIGIGTAVFSLVNVSAIRGFGVRRSADVFDVKLDNALRSPVNRGGWSGQWAHSDFSALQTSASASQLAAFEQTYVSFSEIPQGRLDAVTGNYFELLGVRPYAGRLIHVDDDRQGAASVVVLSYAFWKHRLGADPKILESELRIEGLRFAVCGVAEPSFSGTTLGGSPAPAGWIPLTHDARLYEATTIREAQDRRRRLDALRGRKTLAPHEQESLRTLEAHAAEPVPEWNPPVSVLARPKPTASLAQMSGELQAITAAIGSARGQSLPEARPAVLLRSLKELESPSPDVKRMLAGLMLAALIVVSLACANVGNALLAAAVGRRRETGVRLALGAGRWRVVRAMMTESLLLGIFGAAGGLLLAGWLAPVFGSVWWTDPLIDFAPDRTVFVFATCLTIVVSLVSALIPVIDCRHADIVSAMKAVQPGAAGGRSPMRSLLVGGQAAASIVILLAAALLLRGLHRAATLDVGVDLDRFFRISVGLSGGYDRPRAEAYWAAARERILDVPGVAGVALASSSPFDGTTGPQQWMNGRVGLRATVGDDYFAALRLRMLRGRPFTRDEVRLAAPVAVISERVAREFWGDVDPIGHTLERVWGVPERPDPTRPPDVRVVGVVDEALTSLEMFDAPTIYRPLTGSIHNWQVVVRADGDPASTVAPVLAALKSIDPEQRPDVYFPRDGWRRQLVWPSRLATLSSILGAAGLALALIGLVGVTAFTAGQRRHEASVRTALGARTGDVVRLFCRDSLRPVALGLGIGVVGSFWTSRLLAGMLYGVGVHDPVAFGGAILTLLIGATLAAFIPALRAARVDPAQLLRSL